MNRTSNNNPVERMLFRCGLSTALLLLAGTAGAQVLEKLPLAAPDHQLEAPADEAPLEVQPDAPLDLSGEPLDLSTPEPGGNRLKAAGPMAKPAGSGWDGKAGIDYRKPSIPAAEWQPDQLVAGAIPDQSTGVAWANVTAPGLDSPLGWDKTAIETRVDPSQEQGRLGTTLSRSVPVGDDVALTLQNGVSVTRTLPSAAQTPPQTWSTSQAVRFNILPTDTTLSLGANISSTDEKWLRTLSAEQKLFGGPVSVTGSVSETTAGDTSKSLKAGFKRTW